MHCIGIDLHKRMIADCVLDGERKVDKRPGGTGDNGVTLAKAYSPASAGRR